ncbi:Cellular retinaldehyde binding/alpha-tocopherol transport [Corchorus capsularis]|uniref:Cellular retinaldehyde binding/alpha-tocopherol transport n=1 Tax=Corchorus capsularis TaxID=210143 RepID=A0A1R3JZN5_COCAP|nr:Cellular retinaldehyde binding/alpha-tocopherol transport [Corchorus capsularis]
MANETPTPAPPVEAPPPAPPAPEVTKSDAPAVLEKDDPSPPSPAVAVSVSVTESASTAIAETEEQTPPPPTEPDTTDCVEKVEQPPPPPLQPVESESEPPAVTEKIKEEEAPAATENTKDEEAPAVTEKAEEKVIPSVTEKTKEEVAPEATPAQAAATVVESKSELPQPPTPPPQEVVSESRSLAAMMEKDEAGAPEPTLSTTTTTTSAEEDVAVVEDQKKIPQNLGSFKEESNKVADLSDTERKALEELKQLVQEALDNHLFTSETKSEENPEKEKKEEAKEVSIWGIPLLKDDRSDVILLKFLRARDFKVKDAFAMIKSTIQWRKDFGIEELLDEDLGDDMDKVVFMHGQDREGHPVCYNVYGEFQNKDLYQKAFSDEEKRMKFLRWRIQFLEKSIRKLDFSPGGVCTIFQVSDLKNSPGPGKRELRIATKQALQLLQDNYPEFVAKQVFVNVPWWYLAFYTMISPFLTQRTKSKFVFAGPAKSAETLFKYISPEQVPIQYGGLSVDYCDCNPDFSDDDPATELTVKPGTKQTVEITIYEKCVLVWELRVVGWEVSYGAEFMPNAKDSYTVIIQKPTKMSPKDEPVVSQSFKVGELGKVLLTVDNPTSKKKKLLYRFKVKPLSD